MERAVQHSMQAMYVGIELADKHWKLAFCGGEAVRIVTIAARDLARFLEEVRRAKRALRVAPDAAVYSCYEAGRDGFWVHRFLLKYGITNVIVDPASIEVPRRHRRAKTDRLDARKLLRLLVRHWRADDSADWRVVRVPGREEEDHRRIGREVQRLKKERTQHRARLKSLAVLHGIRLKSVRVDPTTLRDWEGKALPAELCRELGREQQRLALVDGQISAINRLRRERLSNPTCKAEEVAAELMKIKGIGMESAWLLGSEFFGWRDFMNRRQVGSAAGLTGTPYNTGNSEREQGISKAGNPRVRRLMTQLAWGWLRFQPDSALTQWYQRRFAHGPSRMRRVGIVAQSRKLLVKLWRYVETGEIPEGVVLRSTP